MSDDEKTCRSAIDNLWRGRPWGVAMRREANRALDRLIAAARAEGFARAREMAAARAFDNTCVMCDEACSYDPEGGEFRTGAWEHAKHHPARPHLAEPRGYQGAENRIRAMQDEGGR